MTVNSPHIQVKLHDWSRIDKKLADLPVAIRGNELANSLRKIGRDIVRDAKRLVQQPGKPGYYENNAGKRYKSKQSKKPLKDTIGAELRRYSYAFVMVAGPQYPAGAHGHLVEYGHRVSNAGTLTPLPGRKRKTANRSRLGHLSRGTGRIVGQAREHPFIRPAAPIAATVESEIIKSLEKSIAKVLRA